MRTTRMITMRRPTTAMTMMLISSDFVGRPTFGQHSPGNARKGCATNRWRASLTAFAIVAVCSSPSLHLSEMGMAPFTARCNRRCLLIAIAPFAACIATVNALWSILKTFNVKQQAVSVAAMSSSYFMYSLSTSLVKTFNVIACSRLNASSAPFPNPYAAFADRTCFASSPVSKSMICFSCHELQLHP